MDDLTNQLRALGEASEAAVSATSAEQIMSTRPTDIAVVAEKPDRAPDLEKTQNRRGHLVLAGVAAVLLISALSITFLRANTDERAELDIAGQTASLGADFAVPADDNGWEDLRYCESTSTYDIDSGNTFYGAYQFTFETFRLTTEALGLHEYVGVIPSVAPPQIQDAAANALYLDRGDEPWPICGRFARGPMITPVVPQWINQIGARDFDVIVFLDPDIEPDRVDEIRLEIETIVGDRIAASGVFFDQQQSFEEFQTMFVGTDDMRNSVRVQDIPPSVRMVGELNPRSQLPQLRSIDGVFNVTTPDPSLRLNPAPPMKLFIPVLDLSTPIYPTATNENLAKGATVLGGTAVTPVIAGYGSIEGAVFADLGDLEAGDMIDLSLLTPVGQETPVATEVTRRYEVIEVFEADLDELPILAEFEATGLTLVADVANDPARRLIVHTEPSKPDTQGYDIDPEG